MRMVALKEFRYAGKQLLAGDPFEARERDVKLLRAIKNAHTPDEADTPSDDSEKQETTPEVPAKRTYKRRDMKAE